MKKKRRTRAWRKRQELIRETLERGKGLRQINKHRSTQIIMSMRKESRDLTSDREEFKNCTDFLRISLYLNSDTPLSTMKLNPDTEEMP